MKQRFRYVFTPSSLGRKCCIFFQMWIIKAGNMTLFDFREKCLIVQPKLPLELYQSPLFLSSCYMYLVVLFSCSVMSSSLQPHGPQHTRLPCPFTISFTCPLSWSKLMSIESKPSNHLILCHPLLLLPSVFPSIMPFPKSWLFTSGSQSIGALV